MSLGYYWYSKPYCFFLQVVNRASMPGDILALATFCLAVHMPLDAFCDRYNKVEQHFSFIYNQSDNQKNYSSYWELEKKRKPFIKYIFISKAGDVHGQWFFSFWITVMIGHPNWKQLLQWNCRGFNWTPHK